MKKQIDTYITPTSDDGRNYYVVVLEKIEDMKFKYLDYFTVRNRIDGGEYGDVKTNFFLAFQFTSITDAIEASHKYGGQVYRITLVNFNNK